MKVLVLAYRKGCGISYGKQNQLVLRIDIICCAISIFGGNAVLKRLLNKFFLAYNDFLHIYTGEELCGTILIKLKNIS